VRKVKDVMREKLQEPLNKKHLYGGQSYIVPNSSRSSGGVSNPNNTIFSTGSEQGVENRSNE